MKPMHPPSTPIPSTQDSEASEARAWMSSRVSGQLFRMSIPPPWQTQTQEKKPGLAWVWIWLYSQSDLLSDKLDLGSGMLHGKAAKKDGTCGSGRNSAFINGRNQLKKSPFLYTVTDFNIN